MSDDGDGIWDWLLDCWWGQILVGIFFFGIAALLYWYISDLEETGRSGRAPCMIAIVYNIAGKWGTVVLLVVPGLIAFGVGIRNMFVVFRGDDKD